MTAVVLRGEGGEQEVLLVRRADNGEWTPVTGIIEPGEEPAVGAAREVLEETGVLAEAQRLVWVHAMEPVQYANGDQCQFLDLVFRLRYVSGVAVVGDDESTDARWFRLDELPRLPGSHPQRIALAVQNAPEARFEL